MERGVAALSIAIGMRGEGATRLVGASPAIWSKAESAQVWDADCVLFQS